LKSRKSQLDLVAAKIKDNKMSKPNSYLEAKLDELVTANRILGRENVCDAFGHVSIRHPDRDDRYFVSRSRAPERIERDDLMEFTLDGEAIDQQGRSPYAERHIHGAIYAQRPDVHSVVHNHSMNVIPFGVTKTPIRPILHMCASMGCDVPVWDSRDKFGDTNLLVRSMDMGYDLAEALGDKRVALMRGHGCVVVAETLRLAVFASVYLEMNAEIQLKSHMLAGDDITFLSEGEVEQILGTRTSFTIERAWERWARRADRAYDAEPNKAEF
jgi:ribulose-5-phosphate 4-epimerase/fuculose-1-phosphate aldolase